MKIRGKKVEQGIKIKSVGLTAKEKEMIVNTLRRIRYNRRREKLPRLSEITKLQ